MSLAEWLCEYIFHPNFLGTVSRRIDSGPWSDVVLEKTPINQDFDDAGGYALRWRIEIRLTPSYRDADKTPISSHVDITDPVNWGDVSRENFLQYTDHLLSHLERKIQYTNQCDEITPVTRVIPDQYGEW